MHGKLSSSGVQHRQVVFNRAPCKKPGRVRMRLRCICSVDYIGLQITMERPYLVQSRLTFAFRTVVPFFCVAFLFVAPAIVCTLLNAYDTSLYILNYISLQPYSFLHALWISSSLYFYKIETKFQQNFPTRCWLTDPRSFKNIYSSEMICCNISCILRKFAI